ncbi:MgtC/SapB family protein [Treponema brennaborense]|uniref:MgtC/SapB transporter n=1 Tax=Treponema brennaborense (strain DSM 12168 / CIP 105900 / DD5/3) TaxID=906968 RepID=F4LMX5_TREBD|nr:MgtC/SapB family protein [Treponema brennaborense]AEE15761.1 MgtC/SapB transporter [Treponema brennaborense DSM 12168]
MNDVWTELTGSGLEWYVCLFRVVLSFFAGCILGLERKFRMQFVGMRTLILICVSSSVLMMLSVYMSRLAGSAGGDPARLASQVVSGIGFLGGGAILRQGFNVKGLTSAAIIWTAAALGLALGAGFVLPAGIALTVCVISLVFIEKVEDKLFPTEQLKNLRISYANGTPDEARVRKIATESGIVVSGLKGASSNRAGRIDLVFSVRVPKYVDFCTMAKRLKEDPAVTEIFLND